MRERESQVGSSRRGVAVEGGSEGVKGIEGVAEREGHSNALESFSTVRLYSFGRFDGRTVAVDRIWSNHETRLGGGNMPPSINHSSHNVQTSSP